MSSLTPTSVVITPVGGNGNAATSGSQQVFNVGGVEAAFLMGFVGLVMLL